MDNLTVLYVKGNIDCLDMNTVSCYGRSKSSEFINLSNKRIGSRLAENKMAFVVNLDIEYDSKVLDGVLESSGNVIGLINKEYESYFKHNKLVLEKILQNGGCIISLVSPSKLDINTQVLDADCFKISLSDAVIITEMNNNIPIEKIKSLKKELYCISFPDKHRNEANERFILSGQALPVKNRDDIVLLSKKILRNYYQFKNCNIHCLKSSEEINYYDMVLLETNNIQSEIDIFEPIIYYTSKIEIQLNNNRIIRVIDHLKRRIYEISDKCMVIVNKEKFKKFSLLYDAKNIINNCDIRLYYGYNEDIRVSVETYNRNALALYSIGYDLYNNIINLEFNNKNELVYIFDKEKDTYYYPLKSKRIVLAIECGRYQFREIYFDSEYDSEIIHPRRHLDWDHAIFIGLEGFMFKCYPNSNDVFRVFNKITGSVYYINPLSNKELYKVCLKDYEENVLTNKLYNEDNKIKKNHKQNLKQNIQEQLLQISRNGYNYYNIEKLKKYIYEQLEISIELSSINKIHQEFINDYKYEQICSAIDEIMDMKSKKVLKENQKIIFDILEKDLDDLPDDDLILLIH